MNSMPLGESVFVGVMISIAAYGCGVYLNKKTGLSIMNPLLISVILVVAFLLLTGMSYAEYQEDASVITYMLTPATICLALPLYEQFELLKKNKYAVIAGITTGVISSLLCILALAAALNMSHTEFVTFLPKSITTAIGLEVSKELGGIVPLTVVSIVITGITGNVFAEWFFKLIGIDEPIAKGIALGSASHAIGTARAMEMGDIEGAMSSLSIVVCGLLTVVAASFFSLLY